MIIRNLDEIKKARQDLKNAGMRLCDLLCSDSTLDVARYVLVHREGFVPLKKSVVPSGVETAEDMILSLRECYKGARFTIVSVMYDGDISVEDGDQYLEILDAMRSAEDFEPLKRMRKARRARMVSCEGTCGKRFGTPTKVTPGRKCKHCDWRAPGDGMTEDEYLEKHGFERV